MRNTEWLMVKKTIDGNNDYIITIYRAMSSLLPLIYFILILFDETLIPSILKFHGIFLLIFILLRLLGLEIYIPYISKSVNTRLVQQVDFNYIKNPMTNEYEIVDKTEIHEYDNLYVKIRLVGLDYKESVTSPFYLWISSFLFPPLYVLNGLLKEVSVNEKDTTDIYLLESEYLSYSLSELNTMILKENKSEKIVC